MNSNLILHKVYLKEGGGAETAAKNVCLSICIRSTYLCKLVSFSPPSLLLLPVSLFSTFPSVYTSAINLLRI